MDTPPPERRRPFGSVVYLANSEQTAADLLERVGPVVAAAIAAELARMAAEVLAR